MNFYDAIILAIVEGITEFLPVSSTAHLVIASQLLQLRQTSFLRTFEIVIQIAPVLSILFIYQESLSRSINLWIRLIAAFIPTGIAGLFLHEYLEELFSSSTTLLWMVITGLAFLVIESYLSKGSSRRMEIEEITLKQSVIIGIFQAFSLIPGISRSGSTILGALLLGLKREAAMSFSFLLAIPTMGIATLYVLYKEYHSLNFEHIELLLVGFVISFVVGYIAVKSFLAIVSRYNFTPFGYYLIVSAILMWFLL